LNVKNPALFHFLLNFPSFNRWINKEKIKRKVVSGGGLACLDFPSLHILTPANLTIQDISPCLPLDVLYFA
jgi:hypothetical protein